MRRKRYRAAAVGVAMALLWGGLPVSAAEPAVLRDRVAEALRASEAMVDLSDISPAPADLRAAYIAVLCDDPALFYVAPRLSYALGGDGACVAVYPTYTLSGEQLAAARAFYTDTVARLVAEAEAVFEGHPRTEAEVALFVHDRMAARYDYDVRAVADSEKNRDAYTFFRDGVGVCQAYAMAAVAVFRALGMEADLVTSSAMNHAWIHVRVGGNWYHMDITRDDPLSGGVSAGLVTHTRLLRSDAGLLSLGYHDFSCVGNHTCIDTRYETPAVMTALGEMTDALCPMSLGQGSGLVWLGENTQGAVCSLRVGDGGIGGCAPWDIDGDGTVTLGDLLLLSDSTLPSAWQTQARQLLLEKHQDRGRTDISPESNTETPALCSTTRP